MSNIAFIPTTKEELGGAQPDFILVSGDAYVDHPSFGAALIGRFLQSKGFSVALISQPGWQDGSDFESLGMPKLAFMVAAGNMDSLVNHYTSAKKPRKQDMYSPGGKAGHRPDRATIVYCNKIRQVFPGAPIIIAGIEASLRRFAHYDYWSDKVRQSILVDSGADMLIYGMAEHASLEVGKRLRNGEKLSEISGVPGTCHMKREMPEGAIEIASFDEVKTDKTAYAKAFSTQYREHDPIRGRTLAQKHGTRGYLIAEKPAMPLSRSELDELYSLEYTYKWHSKYDKDGGVPALSEIKFSITYNRGCYGECAFCALAFHQGRIVQSRSVGSVVQEAKRLMKLPDFKGYIHDIGGPTANFSKPACREQLKRGACAGKRCLSPVPCKNLEAGHTDYVNTLKAVREIPGIKKVFVRSGVRFDYALLDKNDRFIRDLCKYHVSGQLRVAPEHVSKNVLDLMGKPPCEVFDRFLQKFDGINKNLGLDQYAVAYFISSHPGSSLCDAVELALYMKKKNIRPEQVQDFYPTPGTRATCMYYTGIDPNNMKKVYVARDPEEKAMQRALLQYTVKENYALVRKALRKIDRDDLIGTHPGALVPPEGAVARGYTPFDKNKKYTDKKAKTDPKSRRGGKEAKKDGNVSPKRRHKN
ncbi:MAG: YgiQ family radical SAM protein [Clostridiales bacterium]|nr:YgiQ family radical SAM protein [Clostridiales bacterium]